MGFWHIYLVTYGAGEAAGLSPSDGWISAQFNRVVVGTENRVVVAGQLNRVVVALPERMR